MSSFSFAGTETALRRKTAGINTTCLSHQPDHGCAGRVCSLENPECAQKVALELGPLPPARPAKVKPCEIKLIGEVDRLLSEMKYVLDNPQDYDTATYQTFKHHIEDLELFTAYAKGRLADIKVKSLPPVAVQAERGY